MSITLRDENSQDAPFLLSLYATTRAQEMARVPWTLDQQQAFVKAQFEAQHSFYTQQYPSASYQVILQNGDPIGRLYILRQSELIRVLDITIVTEKRGKGIGSQLLKRVLDEGRQSQKPVQIYVEDFNPSLPLFEKLGFSPRADEGFNFLLEWIPEAR